MREVKKILAFILACQMLCMTACSQTTGQETETAEVPAVTDEVAADPEEGMTELERRAAIPDNLPEMTFDGQAFRILTGGGAAFQFDTEELTGENTNDAVFERNSRVEERFDFKIETIVTGEPNNEIHTYVLTGANELELAEQNEHKMHTPVSKGDYLNWNKIPYIDQNQPWWNKEANDGSTLNGKLFGLIGDLSITSMLYTYAMFFNMDLMTDFGYTSEEMYSLVNEGAWTIDKMTEIVDSIYEDRNGDGKKNVGDTLGFYFADAQGCDVWVTAVGERVAYIENDEIIISLGTERVFNTLEKVYNLTYNTQGALWTSQYSENFELGRVAFAPMPFNFCSSLRNAEFSYGLLPFPKYDTDQERYYTNAIDQYSIFGTPITVPEENFEFIGIIMEVLNAETYKTVYPEYYDTALKGKYATDQMTANMIDLIMDARTFEFAFQFGPYIARLPYMFRDCLTSKTTALASRLQKSQKMIDRQIGSVYSFYED